MRDGGDGDAKAPGNAQAALRLNGGAAADCANVPAFSLGQFSDGSPSAAVLVKNGGACDIFGVVRVENCSTE